MKKSFKASKKFKVNFGPQDPINKKGYLATIRTGVFLLAADQEVQIPIDKTNLIAGGFTNHCLYDAFFVS